MINGSVQLRGARLAKQRASAQPDGSTDTPFRHALMLADLSGKKNILCADSDLDRDEWVFLVARQVELLRIEKDRDEHQRKAMVVPSHIAAAVPLQTPASTKPIHFAGPTIVEPEQNEQPELVQHSRRPSRSRMASIRSTITRTLIPSRRSSAASKSDQHVLGYSGPSRVFGVPLDEAVKFSSFSNGISVLPSIVYRCVQFLEHSGGRRRMERSYNTMFI